MSRNMTVCPMCDTGFETTNEELYMPIQTLRQECPACDYWVRAVIVNWPDSSYTVVAPALRGDEECHETIVEDDGTIRQCKNDPLYRVQSVGSSPTGICSDCTPSYVEYGFELME